MARVERPIDESQIELCVNAFGYEIETLIELESVTEKFGRSGPAIVYHACLEASLLHARTVIEFLAGRNNKNVWFDNDLQPMDLLPEWPNDDPWKLRRHLNLIDPHLSHLSLERGVIADNNDWSLEEIIEDIMLALREFYEALRLADSPHVTTFALAMRGYSDPPAIPTITRPRRGLTFSTGDTKIVVHGTEVE